MYKCITELRGDEVGFMTTKNKKTGKEYGVVFHSGKQFDNYRDELTDDYAVVTSYIKYDRKRYGKERHDIVMGKEEQKELVSKLLKASNEIHKKQMSQSNYIHLPSEFIQERADEEGVTFDEMVEIVEEELNPKG